MHTCGGILNNRAPTCHKRTHDVNILVFGLTEVCPTVDIDIVPFIQVKSEEKAVGGPKPLTILSDI